MTEHRRVDRALPAIGLSPKSKKAAYEVKRALPDFAARWDAILRGDAGEPKSGSQASGTGEVRTADAKPALGVRPDSPSSPEDDGAWGRAAGASDIVRKPAGISPPAGTAAHSTAVAGDASADRAPFRRRPDAEIVAEALRHQAEREKFALLRPAMTPGEAQLECQRRGRVVYRASVAGGRDDRWYVSGLGNQVTDDQLIELAERLQSPSPMLGRGVGVRDR